MGEGEEPPPPTHRNLFVSPLLRPEILPLLAELRSLCRTWEGDNPELACNNKAEAPETWGQAIDVPLKEEDFESEETDAEMIELPGAHMSTQGPKLLNEDLASLDVVEPTAMAELTKAGVYPQALSFSLPAATTTVNPALVAEFMALSSDLTFPSDPKLMLATKGRLPFLGIQSSADTAQDHEPEPLSSRTFPA